MDLHLIPHVYAPLSTVYPQNVDNLRKLIFVDISVENVGIPVLLRKIIIVKKPIYWYHIKAESETLQGLHFF
jgi:hypothetical protein